ncbi:MAG: hypothetical protein AAFZ07_13950 [Actinomycetota bacterium]
MTGSSRELRSLLWPDETTVATLPGRSLGAAALRLARLPVDRSAVAPGVRLVLVATDQRLVVATFPTSAPTGELAWQLQLPRLAVDLTRLPGQLIVRGSDRFVAVEVDRRADVGGLLAALAGPSS